MIIQSDNIVCNPKVSVVIATYNQVNYIEQTVLSALNQKTSFPFEVVVADDGSNDGERELLESIYTKYQEKLRLIFNDKNLMVTLNYINAIHEARGEYVATLDGDDYYLREDVLQLLVDYLDNHNDVSLVHGGYRKFQSETGKVLSEYVTWDSPMLNTQGIDSACCVLLDDFSRYPLGSSSCFKRKLYVEGCKKYPQVIECTKRFGEGTILNISMGMAGKYGFIPQVLTAYRILPNSLSHFSTNKERFQFNCNYVKAKIVSGKSLNLPLEVLNNIFKVLLRKLKYQAIDLNQLPMYYEELENMLNGPYKNDLSKVIGIKIPLFSKAMDYAELLVTRPVYNLLKKIYVWFNNEYR